MLIITQSARLRRIIRSVLSRIPELDRRVVVGMVRWIRGEREWQAIGLSDVPSRTAARLIPLCSSDEPERRSRAGQSAIDFHLPICRRFTEEALAGIVAHELALALRAAQIGDGWYEQMDRRWGAEERTADGIATGWGFGPGIRAMREERQRCVEPWIDALEEEISQRIQNRDERRYVGSAKRCEAPKAT